jgi:hypothetical protein
LSEIETSPRWRKSSFSGTQGCVEWAVGPSSVRLRNSKDPTGPELILTHVEWTAFIAGVKHGEADLYPDASDTPTEM